MHTGFEWENLKKGEYLEDLCVDGKIILKWILEKWDEDKHWIALVNAVMNLRVP